jgi:uncharacterized membrane protein YsdA (DUF1294 family)
MVWLCTLILYTLMSAVAFIMYAADKRRAQRGTWRVRERTLHLLELLGGWPGAIVAQKAFRHKTRKLSYRLVFGTIVLVHLGAWGWFLWRSRG